MNVGKVLDVLTSYDEPMICGAWFEYIDGKMHL